MISDKAFARAYRLGDTEEVRALKADVVELKAITNAALRTADEIAEARAGRAEARVAEWEKVAKAYEAWEADIIINNETWRTDDLPHLTQAQFDRMIKIQDMRNAALALGKQEAG